MKYWHEHGDNKVFMKRIFKLLLDGLQVRMPDFKVANAVIHFYACGWCACCGGI